MLRLKKLTSWKLLEWVLMLDFVCVPEMKHLAVYTTCRVFICIYRNIFRVYV